MRYTDLKVNDYISFMDFVGLRSEGQIVRMGHNSCTVRNISTPHAKHGVVKYENIYRVIDMPFEPETFRACIQELQEI